MNITKKEELLELAEKRNVKIEFAVVNKVNTKEEQVRLLKEDGRKYEVFPSVNIDCSLTAEQILDMLCVRTNDNVDVKELTSTANIHSCLMNAEKNEELLRNIPHRALGDLAIYYRFMISSDNGVLSSIITNELIDSKGWTEEQLNIISEMNNHLESKPMHQMISELMGIEIPVDDNMPGLHVVTNKLHNNGAGEILTFLKRNGNKNFYIIPSSIHECLALETEDTFAVIKTASDLKEMVMEVNATEVAPSDFLSDNVYYYSALSGRVSVL